MRPSRCAVLALSLSFALSVPASAQWTPEKPGSDNIEILGHTPLGPRLSVADMELEQELSRPYAYVSRNAYGGVGTEFGTDIVDLSDPSSPKVIYRWRIENQDLHLPNGGMDVKYFKLDDRYYVVQSLQFGQGGPNHDLGAVVLDVTGLPDPASVREVARIHEPDKPRGFHNIFIYKHSDGRVLLFATVQGPTAHVYDLERVVAGDMENALVGHVPVPQGGEGGPDIRRAYHDFYVGYHPDTATDRFYGGGVGGYYIYDVTDLDQPELLATLTGIDGVRSGHTFTPGPNGRFVIAETEYRYAPLRIFDLQPALDGEVSNIDEPISAWTADWKNLTHNHEVRWPYVFVSGYLDGLQVFSLHGPARTRRYGCVLRHLYLGPPNKDPLRDVQRSLRRGRAQRGRPDRGERHEHRDLDVPHGGLSGLERRAVGRAGHLERAEVGRAGPPTGEPAVSPTATLLSALLAGGALSMAGSPASPSASHDALVPVSHTSTVGVTGAACVADPEPPDYYRFPMVTTRRVPGTGASSGTGAVSFPSNPFGVALAEDGSYLLDVTLEFERLRAPRDGGVYAVWFTTPQVDEVTLAGVLDPEGTFHSQIAWNKFLVVITLEPDEASLGDTWTGPIVLRGMSRSGLMHTMAGHGPFEKENCASYGY